MERKSIFETLSNKFDYGTEIRRIETLLTETDLVGSESPIYYDNIQDVVNTNYFITWKNRNRCLSCEDMREQLGIENIIKKNNVTVQEALIYIEYAVNIIYLFSLRKNANEYFLDESKILQDNLNELLEHLNFSIKYYKKKEYALIIEKNPSATAVADIVDEDTAFKVFEYNHYLLKGNLDWKREILVYLGDKFEPISDKLIKCGFGNISKDVGFLLNNINIRHNNLEGKSKKEYTASLTKKQLEEWYDKTYDVLLLSFLTEKYIDLNAEIKDIKTNY